MKLEVDASNASLIAMIKEALDASEELGRRLAGVVPQDTDPLVALVALAAVMLIVGGKLTRSHGYVEAHTRLKAALDVLATVHVLSTLEESPTPLAGVPN